MTHSKIPKRSKQEIFDFVVNHLRLQGKKPLNEHGTCAYRGENNRKCAAGCLIPDDSYSPDMEGEAWGSGVATRDLSLEIGFVNLVTDLQVVHDVSSVQHWEKMLESMAKNHGLIYTPVSCTPPP